MRGSILEIQETSGIPNPVSAGPRRRRQRCRRQWGRGGGKDLFSALPDDMLLLFLLRLPSAADAAWTSVLSRRWRHLWTQLAELQFSHPADLVRTRAALTVHKAPMLRRLSIATSNGNPGDAAAILLLVAPRLTGRLSFMLEGDQNEGVGANAEAGGAIQFPCFKRAERVDLGLGYYLGLVLPPLGVFAKLTILSLERVQFHGPDNLGEVLSSSRCPSLQEIRVHRARGLSNLTLHSKTLRTISLHHLEGFQQLTIVSPMLRVLDIFDCFRRRQPMADISAPVLEKLRWADMFDPMSVQLGEVAQLRKLLSFGVWGHGFPSYPHDWDPLRILQRFRKIPILHLYIIYPPMLNFHHLTEVITLLPNIEDLHLSLSANGHAFGPCIFHLLSAFPGIKKLKLKIFEGISVCSPSCHCHQPQDSDTEDLSLNSLKEVEILKFRGAECDLAFLKRLLRLASGLKIVAITFDPSVTVAEELCQQLLGLPGPGTCMRIYLYCDGAKVIYALVA